MVGVSHPPLPAYPRDSRAQPEETYRWRPGPFVISMMVTLGAVGVGFVGLLVWMAWSYANADHLGIFDDPDVYEVVEAACQDMVEEVDALAVPDNAPAAAKQASMRAQNDAVRRMLREIRLRGTEKLEGDHPATYWLEDWETLISARETYAVTLEGGVAGPMPIPMTDGSPITQRMNDSDAGCEVPWQLLPGSVPAT